MPARVGGISETATNGVDVSFTIRTVAVDVGVVTLVVAVGWFAAPWITMIAMNAADGIASANSIRSGGRADSASPADIASLRKLTWKNYDDKPQFARVVTRGDYAITLTFPMAVESFLFRRDRGIWTQVKALDNDDACVLVKLGVPEFTALQLDSAVYSSDLRPPHHDRCGELGPL